MKKLLSSLLVMLIAISSSTINVFAQNKNYDDSNSEYVLFSEASRKSIEISANTCDVSGKIFSNYPVKIADNLLNLDSNNDISGNIITNNENHTSYISNFSCDFMSRINENSIISEDNFTISNYNVAYDKSIFSKNELSINSNNLKINDILAANCDISIGSQNIENLNKNMDVIIFSSNGNININMSSLNLSGIIYAPNGEINISGQNINFCGIIIADSISINADSCKLSSNSQLNKEYKILEYMITDNDMVDSFDVFSCQGTGNHTYYYNTGNSCPSLAIYSRYNLLSNIQKGDVIYEANGGGGYTGHIAYVEGIYYDTVTYYYSSYQYTKTISYVRLIESISSGVCRSILDDIRCDEKGVTVLRLRNGLTTYEYNVITDFIKAQLGKPYPPLTVLASGRKQTNINGANWYCSELIWAAYKYVGYDIETNSNDEWGITPHDIYNNDSGLYTVSYK